MQAGGMQVISSGLHSALTDLITGLAGVSSGKTHEIIYSTIILWFESITNPVASVRLFKANQIPLWFLMYAKN